MSTKHLVWMTLITHILIRTFRNIFIGLKIRARISLLTILSIILIPIPFISEIIIIIKYQILNSGMFHATTVLLSNLLTG